MRQFCVPIFSFECVCERERDRQKYKKGKNWYQTHRSRKKGWLKLSWCHRNYHTDNNHWTLGFLQGWPTDLSVMMSVSITVLAKNRKTNTKFSFSLIQLVTDGLASWAVIAMSDASHSMKHRAPEELSSDQLCCGSRQHLCQVGSLWSAAGLCPRRPESPHQEVRAALSQLCPSITFSEILHCP